MKKLITKKYYTFENIDRYETTYKLIIGERSNGKTYAFKKEKAIEKIKNNADYVFGYIRRRHKYIVRTKMEKLFQDISELCEKELGSLIYYSNGEFYILNGETKRVVGYVIAIEDMYDNKGIPYPVIYDILFDEFIDNEYMDNELQLFINTIATLTKQNKAKNIECTIYMLANTVSKVCPYFKLFKIDPQKLKQGYIAVVAHKKGVTASIEYCKTLLLDVSTITDKKDKYIGFDDDETVSMIMYGDWEAQALPIHTIDGVGWNADRLLIPIYITGINRVFEISIKIEGVPIGFCRVVNTQKGNVNELIKYNFSTDGMQLKNKSGFVPTFSHITSLLDTSTKKLFDLFIECVKCGRVLYTDIQEGTEFLTLFNTLLLR